VTPTIARPIKKINKRELVDFAAVTGGGVKTSGGKSIV
jgi:hypothetical protein